MDQRTTEFLRENIMLHLAVNKEFTYLNYLAVMSAIRIDSVTVWIKEEPSNEYWDIVRKVRTIEFKPIDPVTGITLSQHDYTGRIDIIYIGELTKSMVDEALVDHTGMYEDDGEFETKDMCLVRVYRPELITQEYAATSKSALAQLIRRVLIERVWNPYVKV